MNNDEVFPTVEKKEPPLDGGFEDVSGKYAYLWSHNGRALVRITDGEKTQESPNATCYLMVNDGEVLLGTFRFPAVFRCEEVNVYPDIESACSEYQISLIKSRFRIEGEYEKLSQLLGQAATFESMGYTGREP